MSAIRLLFEDRALRLECRALSGREELGVPTTFDLELFSPDPVDPAEVLGKPCRVELWGAFGERAAHGVVTHFLSRATAQTSSGRRYEARVQSSVARLVHRRQTRVFQERSAPEIVRDLLTEAGFRGQELELRLGETHAARRYVVQFRETDLEFLRRICEEEALTFRFDARDGFDALVLEDDSTNAIDALPGPLPVVDASALEGARPAVWDVRRARRARPGAVRARDYDPDNPRHELVAEALAGVGAEQDVEVYRAPGRFRDPAEGQRRAREALEAIRGDARTVTFTTNAVALAPGLRFELEDTLGAESLAVAGGYVVVACDHRVDREDGRHVMTVLAVPEDVRYRLPSTRPRPRISGVHSAVVTGPAGQEIFTDAAGRVRVRMSWDRFGPTDDKSSLPVRVMQPLLPGSMLVPRVGWEVLVAFEDGDPDRPILIGRPFNAKQPPPFSLPANKTVSALATRSSPGGGRGNSIHFDDAAGRQHMAWSAGFGKTTTVGNEMVTQTMGNEVWSIQGSQSVFIGGSDSLSVTQPYVVRVGSQSASVGGSQIVKVLGEMGITTGSETVTIGGMLIEKVGNPVAGLKGLGTAALMEAASSLPKVGAVAGLVGGVAMGAYQGYQHGGVSGALEGGAGAVMRAGVGMIPGGDAVAAAVEGVGQAPWDPHEEKSASKVADGGGAAAPAPAAEGPAEAGAGNRVTKVGAAMTELIGGLHAITTPADIKHTTLGPSSIVVGGDHSIRAVRVSNRTLGASSDTAASLDVVAGASVSHHAKGALTRSVGGELSVQSGNLEIAAGGALSVAVGGALTLDGGSVVFACKGAKVAVSSGGVLFKAGTVTINGHVVNKGEVTSK